MSEVTRCSNVAAGWTAALCAILVAVAAPGACDAVAPHGDRIEVRNESGVPIVVLALTAETAARADPALTVEVGRNRDRLIPAGGVLLLSTAEIMGGWDADDRLTLFLYRVEGESGSFAGARQVPRSELDAADGRVTIEAGDVAAGQLLADDRGPSDRYLFGTHTPGSYLFRATARDGQGNQCFDTLQVDVPKI